MARNYEKNFGRLNRLWLEKGAVKKEKRPKLSTLQTSDDISYWLPSIKNELDFFLKQMEVPCYTEQKIGECRKHIHYLEIEYKAYVRKLHQLNSALKTTPWTARAYEKQNKGNANGLRLHPMDSTSSMICIKPLETPVLMHDHLYQEDSECVNDNFREDMASLQTSCQPDTDIMNSNDNFNPSHSLHSSHIESENINRNKSLLLSPCCSSQEHNNPSNRKSNVLGLDYSSSDDDTQ